MCVHAPPSGYVAAAKEILLSAKAPRSTAHDTGGHASQTRDAVENELTALLALMQFANIVDFMMVMPLGHDFAQALGMAPRKSAW